MQAMDYIDSLTEEQPEAEPRQNPYSKRNAIDEIDKFENENQENPIEYKIKKVDEFNLSKPLYMESRNSEPDGGWENYIQSKYVDVEGSPSLWEVHLVPLYKDKKGNPAKPSITQYRVAPSFESKKNNSSSSPSLITGISEDAFTKRIKEVAVNSLLSKDDDREKAKKETISTIKELKELMTPDSTKEYSGIMTELIKGLVNKKETPVKDDSTTLILEMQRMADNFNKSIVQMQEDKNKIQLESLRRESALERKFTETIDEIKRTATKPQSLSEQVNDIDKLTEFARKLGYTKEGEGDKGDSWKEIITENMPGILNTIPMAIDRLAQIFTSRNNNQVGALNPNFNPAMPMPNNNMMLPQPTAPNNNPAPQPAQAKPVFQVDAKGLRSLALLNALDMSFNSYRAYNKLKENPEAKSERLEELENKLHDSNLNVLDRLLDIDPTLLDTLENKNIEEELKKFINETKVTYPELYEKYNSIIAPAWVSNLIKFIESEAYEDDNINEDVK